jgi:hypothetical protein
MEPNPDHVRVIRVVSFDICQCRRGEWTSAHLLAIEGHVALKNGNAIAISYAWGEFDPRDVHLGHNRDGAYITMKLGREWPREALMEKSFNMGYSLSHDGSSPMPILDRSAMPQTRQ